MQALKYLYPGWWAIVMGLAGLTLAWHRAEPLLGATALGVALGIGGLAAIVFVLLGLATGLRVLRYPEAWREDRLHPIRHSFIAAIPISILLMATVGVAFLGPSTSLAMLWWLGSLSQLVVTVWVLGRWWRGNVQAIAQAGIAPGVNWSGITPALFIPVVGNVIVPLAGVPLGFAEWSAAQFGMGVFFWPVVLVLIVARLAIQGSWPDRLQPTAFIVVAPPAVIGLALAQFGAPAIVVWALWGVALFSLLWAATRLPAIVKLPFAMPHWALSFPLAAFTALSLRVLPQHGLGSTALLALLALTSLVIAALFLATLKGLWRGELLVPEHAGPQPIQAAATHEGKVRD